MIDLPREDVVAEAWDRLRCVKDPEIGVNVVDLGLVYAIGLEGCSAAVRMTLTTPGCPLADAMPAAVARALETVPGIDRVRVEVVFEPRWTPEMISERGRWELGWR